MIYVLKFLLSGLPISVFECYASTPTKLFTLTDSSDMVPSAGIRCVIFKGATITQMQS